MGVKTLPLLFLGNVRNQRFLYVFWREIREKERERERERESAQKNAPKIPNFVAYLFIFYFLVLGDHGLFIVKK